MRKFLSPLNIGNQVGTEVFTSVADFPHPSQYPVGPIRTANGVEYWNDGTAYAPTTSILISTSNTPNENTSIIQAALNGKGDVHLAGSGEVLINQTLVISSNTKLSMDKNLRLTLQGGVPGVLMLTNFAHTQPFRNLTGNITVVGRIATVPLTNHGFVVGQAVDIAGLTTRYYNLVCRVRSVINANSFTVELYKTPTVTTSTGVGKVRLADENIELFGVNLNWNDQLATWPGNNQNTMSAIFNSVLNFSSREFDAKNCRKYGLFIGAATNVFIQKSNFSNTRSGSDGVHLNGPCYNVVIDDVTGLTGDDAVSFTIGDYADWEISRGDFVNVRVTNVNPTYSKASAVKYAGNAPFTVDNFVVDGVGGNYELNGVLIYDDVVGGSLIGTNAESITVKNINGNSVTNGKQVFVSVSGTVKNLDIEASGNKSFNAIVSITSASAGLATFENINIKAANDFELPTPVNMSIVSFGSFVAKHVTVDVAGQVKSGHGLFVLSTATSLVIDNLKLNGRLVGQGSDTNCALLYHSRGTIKKLALSGMSTSMQQMYYQDPNLSIADAIQVVIPEFASTLGTRLLELQADSVVTLGSITMTDQTTMPIRVRNNKVVKIIGQVEAIGSNTTDIDVIEVVTLNTRLKGNLRADGAKLSLTPVAGDEFYNTNASWSAGSGTSKVGKYAYNGTAWVKLYGAA